MAMMLILSSRSVDELHDVVVVEGAADAKECEPISRPTPVVEPGVLPLPLRAEVVCDVNIILEGDG